MSETSIANLACVSHLGCNKITNLDDDQTEAIVMKGSFDHCRDSLLEEGMWGFANRRDIWTPTTDTPSWGFTFSYLIPSEVIRILTVTDAPNRIDFKWELAGDRILCDAQSIFVKYTTRVTNTNLFTTGFTNALAVYLAYYNCIVLTENKGMKDTLFGEYNDALDNARTNDGMQGVAERIRSNALINVRNGGRPILGGINR